MSVLLIDIVYALLCLSAGFAAACYLKRQGAAAKATLERSQLAELAIARLQELTQRISADVVDHSSRVQQISDELGHAADISPEYLAQTVSALIAVNDKMQVQLASAEKRLQDQAREIESHVAASRTDPLTGLSNRRVFDSEMERAYDDFQRRGRPVSLMLIDVDSFKVFNDTYGHQAGDEVLREVGRMLTRNSLPEHIVCRYGGEEFAIIFPGATMADAAPLGELARRAIAENVVQYEGQQLNVSASGGIAQLLPGEGLDDLIRRADEALYASKQEGRDTAHGHDGEIFYPLDELLASLERAAAEELAGPILELIDEAEGPLLELDEQPALQLSGERVEQSLGRVLGLSTMETFRDDLERRLSETKRSGVPISMLIARIDNYEQMLAKHDKKSTTMVLRAAAQFFKATMRDMDHLACDEDDSFTLLLPTAKLENAQKVAERLRGAVYRCKLPLGGKPFQFTMSFGLVQAERNDCTETLIQRCRAALCQAVLLGGNQCYADTLELEPVEN